MFNGYVLVGIKREEDYDSGKIYYDKDILGISDSEQSMEAIGEHLKRYDKVETQLWYYDTKVQVKTYKESGVELTFSLVNQLNEEMDNAKAIIIQNRQILEGLGLL